MNGSRFGTWKRFSLRTMFVLMTASCVILGVWTVYVNPFRLQAHALAEVIRLGAECREVAMEGPAWQRWLVSTLLGRAKYTRVTSVNLSGRNVDRRAAQSLAGLRFLRELDLDRTQIADDEATYVSALRNLASLSLSFTQVSDRTASALATLPELRTLYLTSTHVSDAAIGDLSQLESIEQLFVRWTRITDAGAERLRRALPNCEVYHDALAADGDDDASNGPAATP